ncbi:hypothetical protein CBF34_00280 [Vagococcus penaei]|uniref:Uncharacterized protein n=1 Tax=Vagococcus penaei TaxID=633807 RepID=A0A1Q2D5A2_9ENTE|nr:hypothetical protein [Vagococcus penaei]AQP53539.1 hypothetical protein BW732_04360 [Vagococcus penaei]RSU07482.1 hypothetical protein CBF34_00280 [Vagococcus penaei]
MKSQSVSQLTYAAILIALGIMIPMVMPVKVVIGPASFTLASHVPVFLAMFVSPSVAALVSLGTAFGFFITLPDPVIATRALSHIIFAVIGAWYLQKNPKVITSTKKFMAFNFVMGLIHVAMEMLVVMIFFMTGGLSAASYTAGFYVTVLLLVGVGGFIHSLVDGWLAYFIGQRIGYRFKFPIFIKAK